MPDPTTKFQIVIYPSEDSDIGQFTAHCLNMDLIADDDTVEGAVSNLLETIEAAIKHNADAFGDAPIEYWKKLENAQELAKELLERIVFNAKKRNRLISQPLIDVESQCDLRQLAISITKEACSMGH